MKKILLFALILLCFSDNAFSARKRTAKKSSSTSKSVSYTTPTQDECNVDIDYCFSRYCFDKKTLTDGVYSKCGATPASTILINVEDCLATRAVIKQLDLTNGCKSYSYNRIVSLLNSKDTIETGLKKNTKECAKATKALQAAKNCYAKMISSDGSSSVELYDELESLCGFEVSGDSYMLNRFYQAGDYGDSNVGALEDLRLTGQNTQKRENWRQVVDATLAGYTEIAELACGAEDYKLTKVNQYALDKRTNSEMVKLYAESAEIGRQTANQIVNHWFRETDCVNSPLPVGGLYWDYKKGGNPDCKIVCKEGYAIGSNSSTCVKIEEENKETFIGLNIGNDWVGANKKVEEKKQEEPAPKNETGNNGGGSNNTPATDYCPKGTKKQLWHPSKGKDGICEVFFPKNGDGTCTHRYYCRHTGSDGEWFSTGDFRSNYDSWFDMKLNNDGDAGLNKIWGTSYSRFGNDYAELLSKDIKSYCLSRCNGVVKKDETPKQNKTYDGSVTCDEIKKVMPNYSEGYVVEFGSYVKANSDKFSSECKAINLGTVTHNGRQYPKTFYTFPKWTELYGEYTAKTMTSSSTYDSKNYMSNVKASIFASEHSVPLARAIRECVCKDEVSTTKKSSQSTTSSETSEKTSTSDDDCPLPKANAWKEAIVLKYIDFMDNSYKGMCGNRSKYINFEEYYAKNRTVPAMDFKYMKDLDNEMIEFRKCVCSDKK